MFEPGLARHYFVVGFIGAMLPVLASFAGLRAKAELFAVLPTFALILVGGFLARRIRLDRIGVALEVIAIFYVQSVIALIFIAIMASTGSSYADPMLHRMDAALGFDWMAFFEICRPWSRPLIFAYASYYWQPLVVMAALILSKREDRLFRWLTIAFVAVIFCAVTFAFLPAQAPYAYYGVSPADFPERPDGIQWTFLKTIDYFKAGGETLGPNVLTGLLTFPSYHATAALLFTWAVWPLHWLRWLVAGLNVMMLVSIPIIGNHYLVDVIAGIIVGVGAICLSGSPRARKRQGDLTE